MEKYRIVYIKELDEPFVIQRRVLWVFWVDKETHYQRKVAEKSLEILLNAW